MRSPAFTSISHNSIHNQFSNLLSSLVIFYSLQNYTKYFPINTILNTLFSSPQKNTVCPGSNNRRFCNLVINYLSYQWARTLLDSSDPISEGGNTMSGQPKTSKWNVSPSANPYWNPKPTKDKVSLLKHHYTQYMYI